MVFYGKYDRQAFGNYLAASKPCTVGLRLSFFFLHVILEKHCSKEWCGWVTSTSYLYFYLYVLNLTVKKKNAECRGRPVNVTVGTVVFYPWCVYWITDAS